MYERYFFLFCFVFKCTDLRQVWPRASPIDQDSLNITVKMCGNRKMGSVDQTWPLDFYDKKLVGFLVLFVLCTVMVMNVFPTTVVQTNARFRHKESYNI